MATFKIGDVVRLKSGGPPMTVTRLDADDIVRCAWFPDDQDTKNTFFPSAALDLFTPPAPPRPLD